MLATKHVMLPKVEVQESARKTNSSVANVRLWF